MTLRCNFLHFSEQAQAGRKPGGRGFVKSWRCWAGASARPPVTFDTCRECDPEVKQARSSFPGHLLGANASLLDLASLQPSQGDPASHSQTFPLFSAQGWGLPPPAQQERGRDKACEGGGSKWRHRSLPIRVLSPTGETGSLPDTSSVSLGTVLAQGRPPGSSKPPRATGNLGDIGHFCLPDSTTHPSGTSASTFLGNRSHPTSFQPRTKARILRAT